MNDSRQRSSSKRTRRGRSPSPRPGCINAASSATPAPAPQQQPSRPHTGSSSYIMNSAGGADSMRRRTPTPPTTIGRTSPMTTSARRMEDGGIGIQTSTTGGTVHVVLGGLGGTTPGSFVPPHLRPAGAVGPTGSSGGRRGLVRRTHSPKTVASPLSKPVHLSELSRCPFPPMSGTGSSSTQQQRQHARPRPILPEPKGSSSKQRRKRKAADDHDDRMHSNKRQTVFLPVGKAASSPPSKGESSKSPHKRRPSSSSSRSRSPKSPRSSSPITPTARVLTIAPTVRGISEAARILRISTNVAGTSATSNTQQDEKLSTPSPRRSLTKTLPASYGILSFPTETVYTLSTCVRLRPYHHHHHHQQQQQQHQNSQTVKSSMGGKMNARSESSSSVSSMSSSSSSSLDGESSGWLGKEMDHTSLNTLLGLKGKQNVNGDVQTLESVGSNCDLPLLYVHSPAQHRHHFQFTRPKTFMIKKSTAAKCVSGGDGSSGQRSNPRSGDNQGDADGEGFRIPCSMAQTPSPPPTPPQYPLRQSDSGTLVPTVTFSESREVLDRITAAFWPGPVAIFAPAKLRRVAELGCPEGKGDQDNFAPVLPPSILIKDESRKHDTTGSNAGKQTRNYVGIRCPSHPLARRCLEEVYYKNADVHADLSTRTRASPGSARGHRHCTKSSVVIGFDASIPTADDDSAIKTPTSVLKPGASATPTKAKEVCVQLLSPSASRKKAACGTPPKEPSLTKDTIPTVHVLDGEDRRELFSHATCEFGPDAFVALIVDDERRTIRIIKRLDPNGFDRYTNVCTATVIRALLRTSPQLAPLSPAKGEKQDPAVAASAGARVITAVLGRWKASEEIIGQKRPTRLD